MAAREGGSRVTDAAESTPHLTPEQTAGYLDRVLTGGERAVVEAHLATCIDCRDEVIALRPLLEVKRRGRRLWGSVALGAAAAAAVILLVLPGGISGPEPSQHRDPALDMAPAVKPRVPEGPGLRPALLAWSPVAQASRYRATVFDGEGSILFRAEATDSMLQLPDSLRLAPGKPYFWKVEADLGWDQWVSSRLVEFTVSATQPAEP
jgi:hypothetical protein